MFAFQWDNDYNCIYLLIISLCWLNSHVDSFSIHSCLINEDPVTGSAHCTLAPYWAAKLGTRALTGFQASARGGVVKVELSECTTRVSLVGHCITTITAEVLVWGRQVVLLKLLVVQEKFLTKPPHLHFLRLLIMRLSLTSETNTFKDNISGMRWSVGSFYN